ncbi:hypothetical protein ABER75_26230 [Niallia taxi]|uniref:hypothetical protein n=1 Tax=Niallia taxi TaxID=2499688 RepID=UPI003D268392
MKKQEVIYDLTTHDLTGLCSHFNLTKESIFGFFREMIGDKKANADSFINYFKLSKEQVLEKEIYLTSLHVTTVKDQFESINKYGLVNLLDAISLNTPLRDYLLEKGVLIDLNAKTIKYGDKTIDISQKYNGDFHKPIQRILYKLQIDFAINAFFSSDDVTKYDGSVNERPEFLKNLSELLNDKDIEEDWISNNSCSIIKFKAHIEDFSIDSFNRFDFYVDEEMSAIEVEYLKRKWIIDKCLDNQGYGYEDEFFSRMNNNISIPFYNIIEIYSVDEYKKAYMIKK